MTRFTFVPEENEKPYAHDVVVFREEEQSHISVIVSDFVDFLLAIGYQPKSIDKYIPEFDPEFDGE